MTGVRRPNRPKMRVTPAIRTQVEALRRTRLTGQAIAERLALPRSTVGRVLRGLGLGRLRALAARPPVIRYQREKPGELIHIDTKKLGRIDGVGHRITGNRRDGRTRPIGWEALHVAIDDASRLAYTAVLPDETRQSAITFMSEAPAFFARHGVTVERVMSDKRLGLPQPCLPRSLGRSRPATRFERGLTRPALTQGRALQSRPRCVTGSTPSPTPRPPSGHRP